MGSRTLLNEGSPIDCDLTVLDLLYREWGERRLDRRLLTPRRYQKRGPYVELAVYASGYTGEEWTSSDEIEVTEGVVERLRAQHYVQGTPEWGYTNNHELRITDAGKIRIIEARKALGERVVSPNRELRAADWIKACYRVSRGKSV
jgi:hypothetical protein